MAYVFRKDRSPFWYAGFDFITPDGRMERIQRSTKRTKERDALALAVAWEEVARKGSEGRLTIEAARDVLSNIAERFTGEKLETASVRAHFDGWLANRAVGLSAASRKRYGSVIRDFLASMGKRAEAGVEHLRQRDVIAFRDLEAKAGKSATTINLDVKIIRSILKAAVQKGLVSRNIAEGVERIEREGVERLPFTEKEIKRLLAAAPDNEWRGLMLCGIYTGARIGDLAGMRWRNVDLAEGKLTFKPEKTRKRGKEIVLPLHPALHSFLLNLPSADCEEAALFPKLAAKKVSGEHGLSKVFARIMKTAKVDGMAVAAMNGKRQQSRRSFHSLRHSAVSMLANAGVAEEVRRKVTGHASGEVHAKYTHHDLSTIRDAVAKLPDFTAA